MVRNQVGAACRGDGATQGDFLERWKILHVDWDVGYTGVFLCQNLHNCTLKTCAFFCMQFLLYFKNAYLHKTFLSPSAPHTLSHPHLRRAWTLFFHFPPSPRLTWMLLDPSPSSSILGPGEERKMTHFLLRKGHQWIFQKIRYYFMGKQDKQWSELLKVCSLNHFSVCWNAKFHL